MIIVQGIQQGFSIPFASDQMRIFQRLELMRDGTTRHLNHIGQICGTKRPGFQCRQKAEARRVGHDFVKCSQACNVILTGHVVQGPGHGQGVLYFIWEEIGALCVFHDPHYNKSGRHHSKSAGDPPQDGENPATVS